MFDLDRFWSFLERFISWVAALVTIGVWLADPRTRQSIAAGWQRVVRLFAAGWQRVVRLFAAGWQRVVRLLAAGWQRVVGAVRFCWTRLTDYQLRTSSVVRFYISALLAGSTRLASYLTSFVPVAVPALATGGDSQSDLFSSDSLLMAKAERLALIHDEVRAKWTGRTVAQIRDLETAAEYRERIEYLAGELACDKAY